MSIENQAPSPEQENQATPQQAKSPEDIIALFPEMSYDEDSNYIQNYNQLAQSESKDLNNENFYASIDERDTELSGAERELQQAVEGLSSDQQKLRFLYEVVSGLKEKLEESRGFIKREVKDMTEEELVRAYNFISDNKSHIDEKVGIGLLDATINKLNSPGERKKLQQEIYTRIQSEFPSKYSIVGEKLTTRTIEDMSISELKLELKYTQDNFIYLINNSNNKGVYDYSSAIEYQKAILKKLMPEIVENGVGSFEGKDYRLQKTADKGIILQEVLENEAINNSMQDTQESTMDIPIDKNNTKQEKKESYMDIPIDKERQEKILSMMLGLSSDDLLVAEDFAHNFNFLDFSEPNAKIKEFFEKIPLVNDETSMNELLRLLAKHDMFIEISNLHPKMRPKYVAHPSISIDTPLLIKSVDYAKANLTDVTQQFTNYYKELTDGFGEENIIFLLQELSDKNPNVLKELYNSFGYNQKNQVDTLVSKYNIASQLEGISSVPDAGQEPLKNQENNDNLLYIVQQSPQEAFKKFGIASFEYMSTKQLTTFIHNNPKRFQEKIIPTILPEDNSSEDVHYRDNAFDMLVNTNDIEVQLLLAQSLLSRPEELSKSENRKTKAQKLFIEIVATEEKTVPLYLHKTYNQVLGMIESGVMLIQKADQYKGDKGLDWGQKKISQNDSVFNQLVKDLPYPPDRADSINTIVKESLNKGLDTKHLVKEILNLPGDYQKKVRVLEIIISNIAKVQLAEADEADKKSKEIGEKSIVDKELVTDGLLNTEVVYGSFVEYYNNLINQIKEGEKPPTIEEAFESFVAEKFSNLSPDELESLKGSLVTRYNGLENQKKAENIDTYISYIQSGSTEPFTSYVEKIESGEITIDTKTGTSGVVSTPNSLGYSISPDTLSFTTPAETISITKQEAKILGNNPEAQENFIHFYETLEATGLKDIWSYRHDIFTVLGSQSGNEIKLDDDYLNQSEMMKFFNAILKSVGQGTVDEALGIDDMIAHIQKVNKRDSLSGDAGTNEFGRSTIEQKFFDTFLSGEEGTITGIFAKGKFSDAIS